MKFEDVWTNVSAKAGLSNAASEQFPGSLSDRTKKRLMNKNIDEIVTIVVATIDEVNAGSIESIDEIVQKKLRKKKWR